MAMRLPACWLGKVQAAASGLSARARARDAVSRESKLGEAAARGWLERW
jgi:hypothetical protein